MIRNLTSLLLSLLFTSLYAQTYSGGGGAIPDDGSRLELTIPVSGLVPPAIDSLSFGLEAVCINVEHQRLADLEIHVIAPDGTTALLSAFNGGGGQYYRNTCFRADATRPVVSNSSPFEGDYAPQGPMGLVNNGQDGNGTWTLRVHDANSGNTGQVISWSITFGTDPANFFHLASSNLPIVVINTGNQPIPDEPKITAHMGIIHNGPALRNRIADPFNNYNGIIGIELRGHSSQSFPKKSYGFELRDAQGSSIDASILGMPAGSDWTLIANYAERSMLNNALTYGLGQGMGRYAPRWQHVEVVLNGEYIGVFLLTEKIKRGSDRVNIAKLRSTDVSGDAVTGGYIVKVDWPDDDPFWYSSHAPVAHPDGQRIRFVYDYPKAPEPEQRAYIQAYVDSFETALAGPDFMDPQIGYRHYADASTFIDLFLVNELSRNVDAYRLSTFLYKDRASKGGRLKMGPLWDYDTGWGNADYCHGNDITGWAYRFSDVCPNDQMQMPFWWERLMQDAGFTDSLRCRWEELREGLFATDRLHAWCDSMATVLDEGQQRNFTKWPTLGTYVWQNPQPYPTTYAGEVEELKDWIDRARGLAGCQHPRYVRLVDRRGCHCRTAAAGVARSVHGPFHR
ncbi:MAG: CotH kinase family protein [Flavobacteriales bacterium]